jgi:hypothetical protein
MESTVEMVTKVSPLTVADFAEMPYSPALLLESRFDASVTDGPEFRAACESGFGAYFDGLIELDEELYVTFVEKPHTWADVVALVDETLGATDLQDWRRVSLAWGAGFGLGWLSAHALVKREDAVMALGRLTGGIERRLRRESVA